MKNLFHISELLKSRMGKLSLRQSLLEEEVALFFTQEFSGEEVSSFIKGTTVFLKIENPSLRGAAFYQQEVLLQKLNSRTTGKKFTVLKVVS